MPPLTAEAKVPRRFKELVAGAQGKLAGLAGLFEFMSDVMANAAEPGKQAVKLSDVVGGAVRVEAIGAKYPVLKNFGMGDLLYYLRLFQSFGVIKAVPLSEAPRRLNEVGVVRTKLSDTVLKAVESKEAALLLSCYFGIIFNTPARNTLFCGLDAGSLVDLAKDERFRKASAYNILLAEQVIIRAGGAQSGKGRPWYEPISDLSGIVALLGALQVVKVRPTPDKLLGLRTLSKIKKKLIGSLGLLGDYILPRGTLVLEMDRIITGREEDPLTGVKYEKLNVGMAKDAAWFRGKVTSRAYAALEKAIKAVKEKKDEIEKDVNAMFSFPSVA